MLGTETGHPYRCVCVLCFKVSAEVSAIMTGEGIGQQVTVTGVTVNWNILELLCDVHLLWEVSGTETFCLGIFWTDRTFCRMLTHFDLPTRVGFSDGNVTTLGNSL